MSDTKKWEYMALDLSVIFAAKKNDFDKLNKAGNQGWELVSIYWNSKLDRNFAIMKKEK